ncbi:MAG: putative glycolipid-binding domain-containing protein, partial [Streptomyces sp.]
MEADRSWTTRGARISGRSAAGSRTTTLTADGAGHWRIDGEAAAHLDGCRDADLESSAMTNAFPVRRMRLAAGARAEAPAAYV